MLQSLQFLLGLDDFTLQRVVLVLTERAVFQLLLRLNLRLFQRIQLLFRGADGILQQFLFLCEQLCVGWVKFQEAIDIL